MHVQGLLHNLLSSVIHQKALQSLTLVVSGLLNHKKLTVTALGRAIDLPIQERSGIRRSDRLIGNKKLQNRRLEIYGTIVKILVNTKKNPRIIVDWTHIPNTQQHLLRASLAARKRAITLYEEIHGESELYQSAIEKKFLQTLGQLLPQNCRPLILTDAGFRNSWFKSIQQLGWDYIGRVRGQGAPCYRSEGGESWIKCKELYPQASNQVKYLGQVDLCKKINRLKTHLFLFKEPPKGRASKKTRQRKHGGHDKRPYQKSAHEPWLLASSLPGESWLKRERIVKLYRLRMQIEESFRDLKCARDGFGLEHAFSYQPERIAMLLLIAMLASFIAWLVGCLAEENGWRSQFQVSSARTTSLSLLYLGMQVLRRQGLPPNISFESLLLNAYKFIV